MITRSGTSVTKVRAALRIIELASTRIYPPVGHYMSQNDALSVIEALEVDCLCIEDDADSCLGSSFEGVILRDARLCLEENQATSSAWSMLGVQFPRERARRK